MKKNLIRSIMTLFGLIVIAGCNNAVDNKRKDSNPQVESHTPSNQKLENKIKDLQNKISTSENENNKLKKQIDEKKSALRDLEIKYKSLNERNQALFPNVTSIHPTETTTTVIEIIKPNDNQSREAAVLKREKEDLLQALLTEQIAYENAKNELEDSNQELNFLQEVVSNRVKITHIDCPTTPNEIRLQDFKVMLDSSVNQPYLLDKNNQIRRVNSLVKKSHNNIDTCLNTIQSAENISSRGILSIDLLKSGDDNSLADAMIINIPQQRLNFYRFFFANDIPESPNFSADIFYNPNLHIPITYSRFYDEQITFGYNTKISLKVNFVKNFEFYIAGKKTNEINKVKYKVYITKQEEINEEFRNIKICIYAINKQNKVLKNCMNHKF